MASRENYPELSNPRHTQFMRFVFPLTFAALLPFWMWVSWSEREMFPALGWGVGTGWVIWWSAPIRRVWLLDGCLEFENGEQLRFENLRRVRAAANNHTPSVLVAFSDRRGRVRRLRIIVGRGMIRTSKHVEIVATLLSRAMYGSLRSEHIEEAIYAGAIRRPQLISNAHNAVTS